jgi:hypothetical protein
VVTFLIGMSGNRAVPSVWLMFAALCGLLGTYLAYRKSAVTEVGHSASSVPAE